jgi:very-short-patch-repair endonuclease
LRNGKSYDDIYGVKKANSIKSKIAITTALRNQTINPLSKPHMMLKGSMIKEGIYSGFESCQPLYYFEIDELNKSNRICVEVDGDYWHSLPKRIVQDKRKDTFLTNRGYKVIRIKECEIYSDVSACINKIKSALI